MNEASSLRCKVVGIQTSSRIVELLNETSYEGYWWLPHDAEEPILGRLHVDEQGAVSLSTLGYLVDDPWSNETIDTITGITAEGSNILAIKISERKAPFE